jgi:hypothetical protein
LIPYDIPQHTPACVRIKGFVGLPNPKGTKVEKKINQKEENDQRVDSHPIYRKPKLLLKFTLADGPFGQV